MEGSQYKTIIIIKCVDIKKRHDWIIINPKLINLGKLYIAKMLYRKRVNILIKFGLHIG